MNALCEIYDGGVYLSLREYNRPTVLQCNAAWCNTERLKHKQKKKKELKTIELNMFYQTQTARKPPSACTAITPLPPEATQWFRLLLSCCVRPTALALLCIVNEHDSAVFRFCPRWPWHSNSSEPWTKRVLPVNLTQMLSAVPEVFHTQTKKQKVTDGAKNRTLLACGNNIQSIVLVCICQEYVERELQVFPRQWLIIFISA